MARKYIMLYFDFIEDTQYLTDAERGRLVMAMLEYGRDGAAPEGTLTGNERVLFPVYRNQIDRDALAYDARVLRNAANGKKGGRPRKRLDDENDEINPLGFPESEKRQDKDKYKDKEKDKYKDKEKDEEKDKKGEGGGAKAPRAPTLDEVADYCAGNHLAVNAGAFWNYYQANGWRSGRHPLRDWRAKLREWAVRDEADRDAAPPRAAPANPALNYVQRDYGDDESYYLDLDAYSRTLPGQERGEGCESGAPSSA